MRTVQSPDCPLPSAACLPCTDRASAPTWQSTLSHVGCSKGSQSPSYDGGRGSRDYTYVDDVVDAFVRLIDAPAPYVLVNIGGHSPVTTGELVDRMEHALGVQAIREAAPAQPGDVPATYADISRARELLGWEPRVGLDEGLARFGAWLRPLLRPREAVQA